MEPTPQPPLPTSELTPHETRLLEKTLEQGLFDVSQARDMLRWFEAERRQGASGGFWERVVPRLPPGVALRVRWCHYALTASSSSEDAAQRVGPYRLLGELGKGGMGTVYRAVHTGLNHEVALKLLHAQADEDDQARFRREAESAMRLQHPNLVGVSDFGQADGLAYMAMQLIEGESLDHMLRRRGALPVVEVVRIARQLADGLGHAHAHGVLHRDLKPSNVLLSDDRVLLADFGLAKPVQDESNHLTQTGSLLGSPAYMAPEQARGLVREVGPHTDVYGFGATLFELLTGAPPFTASTSLGVLTKVLDDPAPHLPSDLAPPALDALLQRCLAKDPAERFPDAHALLPALDDLLVQLERPLAPAHSLRAPLVGAALTLCLAIGVVASRPDAPPTDAPAPSSPPTHPTPDLSGEPPVAHANLVRWLTTHPTDLPRWELRLEFALALSDLEDALESATRAADLDPADPERWSRVLDVQLRLGRLDSALATIDLLEELGDDLEPLRHRFARAALDLEQPQRALTVVSQGSSAQDAALRGIAHEALGDDHAALQSFAQAVDLDPSDLEHRRRRSLAAERLGEVRLALQDLEVLQAAQPTTLEHRQRRVRLLAVHASPEAILRQAVTEADEGLQLAPMDSELRTYRAYARHRLSLDFGDFDALALAIEEVNSVCASDPDHVAAHRLAGRIFLQQGLGRQAFPHLERVVELNPTDTWARLRFAILLHHDERHAEALPHLERVTEDDPQAINAWVVRARCLNALERFSEAMDCLVRAREIDANRPQIWIAASRAFRGLGQPENEISSLRHALTLDPESVPALSDLALALMESDDPQAPSAIDDAFFAFENERDLESFLKRAIATDSPNLSVWVTLANNCADFGFDRWHDRFLKEIVGRFPDSPAAAEARGLLQGNSQ